LHKGGGEGRETNPKKGPRPGVVFAQMPKPTIERDAKRHVVENAEKKGGGTYNEDDERRFRGGMNRRYGAMIVVGFFAEEISF